MENETQEEVVTQVEQKSSLHQVTPLSKYSAVALFVILPFIGGWIGYTYAPEKVVEVERVIEVEKVITKEVVIEIPAENSFDKNSETLTTIRTSRNNQTPQLLTIKDYQYNNGSYSVDFSFVSRRTVMKDDYSPSSDNGFYKATFYENAKDMTEPVFRYYVHGEGSVLSGLADGKEILSDLDGSFQAEGIDVSVGGREWGLYGAYKRCDIGGCDTAEYLYSKIVDEYRQYLLSDVPLHEDDEVTDDILLVLESLRFEKL
jgi:hypothetical protein